MTSKESVLIAGVDTLIVNVKFPEHLEWNAEGTEQYNVAPTLSSEMQEVLELWLERSKAEHEPFITTWDHEKQTLKMHPKGTTTHKYLLKNGFIDLLIGPYLQNNALARVRFSSEYLWRRGAERALVETHAFLWNLFMEDITLQCSEIHLCADVAHFTIPHDYERFFISHAVKERPIKASQLDRPVYRYHEIETLQFSGHGNPVSVSIYDKPAEIKQKSPEKVWFHDLWKIKGWEEDVPVWRVECRIKREALHEMDIEDAYDALFKIPALWAYCVGHAGQKDGWVRMLTINRRDSNRRRWNTASAWVSIQKAFEEMTEGVDIADVQRERKREVNKDRAEKAIAGYTTTYAAWLQDEINMEDDASIVMQRLYQKMLEIWEKRGEDFHALRIKKQYVYHLA